jgi:protein-S-isoprenylcysteine O-methyltransferase Ste14
MVYVVVNAEERVLLGSATGEQYRSYKEANKDI